MHWIKLGKIFDPNDHSLPGGCSTYAQSPQALVLKNKVRIFFSTRIQEKSSSMFLSKVAYVDFSKDLSEIIGVSESEVVPLGALGAFDEHGIFPFSPTVVKNKVYAYTCGWNRRISVPVETSTGLVVGDINGNNFTRIGNGPIMAATPNEPYLVGDSFVRVFNDMFHMWYIYGKYWIPRSETEPPARVYKIGQATSEDGINWERNEGKEIVQDYLNKDECQALPTVIKVDDTYHMYFCYREATDFRKNPERAYRLGYAYSNDLINWTRDEDNVGIQRDEYGWDSEMMCYPNLFEVDNNVYLLYNGNEFGKYGFGLAKLESI